MTLTALHTKQKPARISTKVWGYSAGRVLAGILACMPCEQLVCLTRMRPAASHSCKVSSLHDSMQDLSLPDSMQDLSIMGWGWDVNARSPTVGHHISKSY